MNKIILTTALALSALAAATAQEQKNLAFRHLDLSVSAGSTGLGFELATPVTSWMDLRAGATFMPHINANASFQVTNGKIIDGVYVETGSFAELKGFFRDFTGYDVRDAVRMTGHPTANNFKFLMDFKPFTNKNWRLTAGFYWGTAEFARGINSINDAVTLLGVGLYNNMYDNLSGLNLPASLTGELYDRMRESQEAWGDKPWLTIGDIELNADPFMSEDELHDYCNTMVTAMMNGLFDGQVSAADIDQTLNYLNIMKEHGHLGVYLGTYTHSTYERNADGSIRTDADGNPVYKTDRAGNPMKKGSPYVMLPDHDGTAKVRINTNRFKPYLGFGYGREINNTSVKGLKFSVDCGVLFWGGTPKVLVHDGTDLSHDVSGVPGRVGNYVSTFKAFKVYPVLNLSITKRIF